MSSRHRSVGYALNAKYGTINAHKLQLRQTETESLLIKNSGGTDVFKVDTENKEVTISGDLTTTGNVTTLGESITSDNILLLNHQNAADVRDGGVVLAYTSSGTKYRGIVYDQSSDLWRLFSNMTAATDVATLDFTGITYGDLQINDLTVGAINGNTVTPTQWGYLAAMDQSVATTDDVAFNSLTIDTDTLVVNATTDRVGINTAVPTVDLDVTGAIAFTTNLNSVTAAELSQLETLGATVISAAQWVYLSNMDQDLGTTDTVNFDAVIAGSYMSIAYNGGTTQLQLKRNDGANITMFADSTHNCVLLNGGNRGWKFNTNTASGAADRVQIHSTGLIDQNFNDPEATEYHKVYELDNTENRYVLSKDGTRGCKAVYSTSGTDTIQIATDAVTYFNGGNVAIGKTSASVELDVSGDIAFTGNINSVTAAELSQLETIGATVIGAGAWGYLAGLNQALTTVSNVTFGSVASTGDMAVDTDTLFVNATTDRVGINTAAPAVDLDVVGSIAFTGNLNSVTATELSQLETIGATTISAAQWGYLGALNQGLTTTSSVTFNSVSATNVPTTLSNGTYTPTLYTTGIGTPNVNTGSSTPDEHHYLRVNDEVRFHGNILLRLTGTSQTVWRVKIDLPISSNFDGISKAHVSGSWTGSSTDVYGGIYGNADATNDYIEIVGRGTSWTGNTDVRVSYTASYEIL